MGGYYLLNGRHPLATTSTCRCANNLLDHDYEAAANYPAPGLNFTAGVSIAL